MITVEHREGPKCYVTIFYVRSVLIRSAGDTISRRTEHLTRVRAISVVSSGGAAIPGGPKNTRDEGHVHALSVPCGDSAPSTARLISASSVFSRMWAFIIWCQSCEYGALRMYRRASVVIPRCLHSVSQTVMSSLTCFALVSLSRPFTPDKSVRIAGRRGKLTFCTKKDALLPWCL